jgi:hypothetical protein
MKTMIAIMLTRGIVGVAAAYDLGNRAQVKPVVAYPDNIPGPERQGGDTIASATVIVHLPYADTGTTAGYHNDYDAVCPDPGGTAPDVVYQHFATVSGPGTIDLCFSSYDTKLYVYDDAMTLIACNDDYDFGPPCGYYGSKLEHVDFTAGRTYYIVIDGYGSAYGEYNMEVWGESYHCKVPFLDTEGNAFFSGDSGWYLVNGADARDTDCFALTMGPQSTIEITACAGSNSYLFELGPQDCNAVGVIQSAGFGYWEEGTMTITGYEHLAPVWIWAGPTAFSPPGGVGNPCGYNIWLTGLEPGVVATAATTWSTVKALYE